MWEQRHAPRGPCVPEAHAGARAESLQERLSRVVLRDVLGWGLSRVILGRCLKDRASQGPSFGAYVLPASANALARGSPEAFVASKGWKPVVAPPFQRNTVNLNHCARFLPSRAIDETDSSSY